MSDVCQVMHDGEVLNAKHSEYPLFHALLYGDKVATAKLSKRVSCTIKYLPIRLSFTYEYDTLKAIEAGIIKDPTLVLNDEIFLEGLLTAEEIADAFAKLLKI